MEWVIVGVVALVVIIVVLMYNSLIYRKNEVEKMEGAIDAILKKRHDLIPNLVSTVKEYMKYERDVLEKITQLRSMALSASNEEEKMKIETELSRYLGRLMVSFENYPNLKASENFMQLQNTLRDIENELSAARRAYNQAVVDYNNAIEMAPTNIMASMMHFKKKYVFEIPEEERENVNVAGLFKD